MSATTAKAMHNMLHDEDPKETIMNALDGLQEAYEPFWNNVLCVIYVRPNKTKSGLFLTEKRAEEDIYQGNVGLVVKMGPEAFKKGEVKVGDWVRFKPEEGDRFSLGGVQVREFQDVDIQGKLKLPDVIF